MRGVDGWLALSCNAKHCSIRVGNHALEFIYLVHGVFHNPGVSGLAQLEFSFAKSD